MEKKLDFAYTYRESVQFLLGASSFTGYYDFCPEAVNPQVDKMISSGWSKEKFLEICSQRGILDRGIKSISIFQIVYVDHPILGEFTDDEIRSSLYSAALRIKADEESKLFDAKLQPHTYKARFVDQNKTRIRSLQKFTQMLSEEVKPAIGIRNR